MLKFECDNQELAAALTRLGKTVRLLGGQYHEGLILRAVGGDLSMTSTLPPDNSDVILYVPEGAFVFHDGVNFKLEGNRLVINSGLDNLDPEAQDRLKLMVRIYNLTDKIEKYKNTSPRCVFQNDPEFLTRLTSGRKNTQIEKNVLEILDTEDPNQIVIKSFLKTRNFAFGGLDKTIIPFIDFTNHHIMARPFKREISSEGYRSMSLQNCKPIPGDDQCFGRYGKWDALDTYLMFGFCNEEQIFVRSIPLEFEVKGFGKFEIEVAGMGKYKGPLPEHLEDLRWIFPVIKQLKPGLIHIANLRIPNKRWPMALKRILSGFFLKLNPEIPLEELKNLVVSAEFKIIEGNLKFYKDLLEFFGSKKEKYKNIPAFREAVKMAKISIREIQDYIDRGKEIGLEDSQDITENSIN